MSKRNLPGDTIEAPVITLAPALVLINYAKKINNIITGYFSLLYRKLSIVRVSMAKAMQAFSLSWVSLVRY